MDTKRKFIYILIISIVCLSSCKTRAYKQDKMCLCNVEENYVPDSETAIKIAEAVWFPIYGKRIYKQKPYVVRYENGIWFVNGSLNMSSEEIVVGGVAYIEICKADGKILNVYHTK